MHTRAHIKRDQDGRHTSVATLERVVRGTFVANASGNRGVIVLSAAAGAFIHPVGQQSAIKGSDAAATLIGKARRTC
jgi:hypothetical protein